MSHQYVTMKNQIAYALRIGSLANDVTSLLDAVALSSHIPKGQTILIKPNVVEALPPPITTPVRLVSLLIAYLQTYLPENRIVVAEGTGSLEYDTYYPFELLGYTTMAKEYGIELIDLNHEKLTRKADPECKRWPVMHLPALLDEVFLISVPVLKAHTLAGVTLSMKNMIGCAPPTHFRGNGHWGKSAFHRQIHEAIFDLNRYRCPDFTLLDASVGMAEAHLWGAPCTPAVNTLGASFDPVTIDAFGASLLGKDWADIPHIRMAHGVLGSATQEILFL